MQNPERLPSHRPQILRTERLAQIAVAADRRFAVSGYEGTSLEQIAGDVGLPSQMVSNYAGSKGDLYVAYFRRARRSFLRRLDEAGERSAVAARGPRCQLELGIDYFFRLIEAHGEAWALVRRRGSAGEAPFAYELMNSRAELARLLAQLLAEGRAAAGNPTVVNTEIAAHAIIGAAEAAAEWWLQHPRVPRGELVERLAALLWIGLERQLSA
ncbi:MAG: hypothetical protein WD844_03850 [Thermoleophilaceae bacterium]